MLAANEQAEIAKFWGFGAILKASVMFRLPNLVHRGIEIIIRDTLG